MPVLSPWATFSMQRRFYMPPEGWTQVAFIRPAVNKCMDCGDPSLGRCLGRIGVHFAAVGDLDV